jgi:hypothetical protein
MSGNSHQRRVDRTFKDKVEEQVRKLLPRALETKFGILDQEFSISRIAFSWVVVGFFLAFGLATGVSFMLAGHTWTADALYIGSAILFAIKFVRWEDAKKHLHPSERKKWNVSMCAGTLLFTAFGILGNHNLNTKPIQQAQDAHKETLPNPAPKPAPGHTTAVKVYKNPDPTPCSMKGGAYYPDATLEPGGPNAHRPYFQLEGSYTTAWSWIGDDYLLWMEFTITNRGEESIAKNWELCLVDDGKAVWFHPGQMDGQEIALQNGDTIKPDDILEEKTIRTPIPHGKVVTGWVGFSVPKDFALKLRNKKMPSGAVTFQDYLAHKFSFDFTGNEDVPTKPVYIPGHR